MYHYIPKQISQVPLPTVDTNSVTMKEPSRLCKSTPTAATTNNNTYTILVRQIGLLGLAQQLAQVNN